MRIWIMLPVVMSIALVAGGCAAPLVLAAAAPAAGMAAAEAGSTAYIAGELRVARPVSLEQAWDATLAALESLELVVHVQRIGQRRWYVMAKDDDRYPEMKIRLDRRSPVLTKISIRVGFFGDPAVADALMLRIDEQLAAAQ